MLAKMEDEEEEDVDIEPPSLEKACFMHLICNLEKYKPESLGLLPTNLRIKLMQNLPIADIFWLEKTALASGIDTVEEVWKDHCFSNLHQDLFQLIMPKLGLSDPLNCKETNWRDLYFLSLSCIIINNYLPGCPYRKVAPRHHRFVEEALFAVRSCLGISNWICPGFEHSFASHRLCCPPRYAWITDAEKQCTSDSQLLTILMDRFDCHPKHLCIICGHFAEAELWVTRWFSLLLQKFLSKVTSLNIISSASLFLGYLAVDVITDATTCISQFILETLLSREGANTCLLESLEVNGSVDFIEVVLNPFSLLLADKGTGDKPQRSLQQVYKQTMSCVPYSGLQSVSIGVLKSEYLYLQGYPSVSLDSIINHQTNLKSVDLSSWPLASVDVAELLSSLAILFTKPGFESLKLNDAILPCNFIKILIATFLSAKSTNTQRLVLHRVDVIGSDNKHTSVLSHLANEEGTGCKILSLIGLKYASDTPLLQWLASLPHLRLHVLYLHDMEMENPLRCFTSNPQSRIDCLYVCQADLQSSQQSNFEALFQNLSLAELDLNCCKIGQQNLLPLLTQGLQKQLSNQTLESLGLTGNSLGQCPVSDLQAFFDVVFSLPKLETLSLQLDTNGFGEQHIHLLYNSWKKMAHGKMLDFLSLYDKDLPNFNQESVLVEVTGHLHMGNGD